MAGSIRNFSLRTNILGDVFASIAARHRPSDRTRRAQEDGLYHNFLRSPGRHALRIEGLARVFDETVNVADVLGDFLAMMQHVVRPNGTITVLHAPDAYAVAIEAWALQMILLEVLTNAVEATAGESNLTITTEPISAPCDAQLLSGDYMKLSIMDLGCGMTRDVHARAFDPFFSTKKAHLGLGLSQVVELLACSGSRASIESAPAHGTTVHLYLRRGHDLIIVPEPARAIMWRPFQSRSPFGNG